MAIMKIHIEGNTVEIQWKKTILSLKALLGLPWDAYDYQDAVTDEFLCMVAGCAWGTDVCHWMFKK